MPFTPGQTVVRRYFRAEYLTWAQAARVVADDERGLLLWVPVGAGFACRVDGDGLPLREAPLDRVAAAPVRTRRWEANDLLIWTPTEPAGPDCAHSVWWFLTGGVFRSWYVNLEAPQRRWDRDGVGGIDTVDLALDVVVSPDRSWRWKDEQSFADFTGRPGYWTAEQAARIRAEGSRLVGLVEAGDFPFDGTWNDFRPDRAWPVPVLPESGWDAPRAVAVAAAGRQGRPRAR